MAIFENLRLDKGLYTTSQGFTATLESIDPSENYIGTPLEGLDAYQRQLKRFDIHITGKNSDTVEKFFKTSDSAALFPEYVSRAVRQGVQSVNQLKKIVATVTDIDALDYRSIATDNSTQSKRAHTVSEGGAIPTTTIKTKENLVKLYKRGRMLVASYEAIRFQRLDLFTVTLRQIGACIARSQLEDAVKVLINGDGNANAADVLNKSGSDLSYADLVALWNSFDDGYELNTLIVPPAIMAKLLLMNEFKDAAAGLDFHGTGKSITPLGANVVRCSSLSENKLIGLDSTCALEMVQAGGIMTDFDKLIDRQLERAAITSIAGFAKIYTDASKVLAC